MVLVLALRRPFLVNGPEGGGVAIYPLRALQEWYNNVH